jgi:single-stranded-DNA-specific exonuclease
LNHRRWKVLPPPPAGYLAGAEVPPLVAQLLHNRGITDPVQAESFLDIAETLQGDPFLLPDMEKAVSRVYHALLSGETIAIYGDFDADGVCGTAILKQGLSPLAGNVISYFPHRFNEGYGLNTASLDSLKEQGVTLVITVDCGISNSSEVEYAQRRGLDVIITDHHTITHGIPPALAVINPKRADPSYPFYQLAGTGVAFKLLQALFQTLGRTGQLTEMLDLVTLGTVADMVPLLGENRYLVKKGLETLSQTSRIGLIEMARAAGLQLDKLETEDITWSLAPRLNAPGRLDHAFSSYRLLVTDSPEEARRLAEEVEKRNTQRQKLTGEFLAKTREQLPVGIEAPLLMIGGENYPPGIVGIIAGKLADEFYRPVFIFEMGDTVVRGSARSIPEFDVVQALFECQDLLLRFGGHPAAAGFALPSENLSRFRQCLLDKATLQLSSLDLRPSLTIEADMPLSSMQGSAYSLIERLAPFGRGNPVPTFLSRRARVVDCQKAGGASRHLKLKLRDGEVVWKAIGFDLGHLAAEVSPEIDVVYKLMVDRWNGEETLALSVLDFAPAC